ncbi:MAG: CCA tRNA nucleotidyltransferase [Candidatus Bathyarchaeota archaeon]|nr:CCA tRNA nucleotidyltransferase [Candidatus Bathyarchaeota archaeon]MDH5494134.1 CCA tRNA nucleotidyltransferase [Candidatus Bathyarchaeota archaeon]
MVSKLERLLSKVLKKTTPSLEEKKHILALAKELKQKVEAAAQKARVDVEVHVEGSIAKNTWLRESPDIDIFMRVPPTVPRKAFGTLYLDIAKEATAGAEQIERFAEHPYLEAILDETRINIVPCYRVEKGKWKSAADRTPFHTDYMKPLLNEKLCGEIRLLKRFMTGIGVYGAEIKVGGFSGYLCELLVLFYDSFLQVLKAASNWKPRPLIDLEGYYEERERELKLIFEEPLVIVDPVDKGRNVASAVRQERLDEFVAASRALLDKPSTEFFYPSETKPFNSEELLQAVRNRGSSLVFIRLGRVKTVPDILWGQLYKSQRSLRKLVKRYDFRVIRDAVWSDEKSLNVFLLEVEHRCLPPLKKHLGPPLEKKNECERFLQKHTGSLRTLSGPRIEEKRWVVEITREYTNVVELLGDKLKDGGRNAGIAELVSQAVAKDLKILVNEEILSLYSHNQKFAKFLTEYLKGKPKWLT